MSHLLDNVKWEVVPPPTDNHDNLPYPTHEGVLEIAGHKLKCFVLNTGERVIDADSVWNFLGLMNLGSGLL